jgi:hypothetical protein
MKHAFEMGSGGIMFKLSFMTIAVGFQVIFSLLPRQCEWL